MNMMNGIYQMREISKKKKEIKLCTILSINAPLQEVGAC